jgi:hypothetical protein
VRPETLGQVTAGSGDPRRTRGLETRVERARLNPGSYFRPIPKWAAFVHVIMPSQRSEKRGEIGDLLGFQLKPARMPLFLKHIFNRPCTAVVQ